MSFLLLKCRKNSFFFKNNSKKSNFYSRLLSFPCANRRHSTKRNKINNNIKKICATRCTIQPITFISSTQNQHRLPTRMDFTTFKAFLSLKKNVLDHLIFFCFCPSFLSQINCPVTTIKWKWTNWNKTKETNLCS